ncbi:MAG: glycerol-3-phosphate dehydrogenase/oxidase [Acidimicrobiia bacterium]|nr:glycerol-3-phosphate dehydrogenase/oxidase [Acidimicrobiia bacterium]
MTAPVPEPNQLDRIGPAHREQALAAFSSTEFDLLVIGCGVTGAGVALDAASRGMKVAVVEQRDIASGTSSRSSKLIHGGLRYLEQFNFSLVKEALKERSLLLQTVAPYMVRPVQFLYPLRHRVWERVYVGAGVLLYDVLAKLGGNRLPAHRHLSHKRALEEIPSLNPRSLVGALQYYDASVDDARHTLAVVRTAAGLGAQVATSMRVAGFVSEGDRIKGAKATCLETGAEFEIRARHVINATGVWTDLVEELAGRDTVEVTASKGIHIVVPKALIQANSGLIIRTEKSVLFMIPWGQHWIIGTTDTKWTLDKAHPAASQSDIEYILERLNTVLSVPIKESDIVGVYAGLRPLLTGESDATSKLSREHAVWSTAPGLTTVAGGKYTTYRVMAEDTVNAAIEDLGGGFSESATESLPLIGVAGYEELWSDRARLAADYQLSVHEMERLLHRHGTNSISVLEIIKSRPELAEPFPGSEDYLLAEAVYAVTAEGALHLDDVLTRRTRISIEAKDRGLAAAEAIAPLMAEVLGWDQATIERELEHYRARVEAELDSQRQPDDHTADAARVGAPDVRTRGRT